MTVAPAAAPAAELPARVVVTAGARPHEITVDVTGDPGGSARVIIGAQQLATSGHVLRGLYAILHGLYGAGSLV